MKKVFRLLIICIALINCICKINQFNGQNEASNEDRIYDINQDLVGSNCYKTVEFNFLTTETKVFFKYENSTLPSSKMTSFRIDMYPFTVTMYDYKVYCVNVESSTTDSELIEILKGLDSKQSSCIDAYRTTGTYDGIVKLDETKTKVGIVLISEAGLEFSGQVNFRTTERILGTDESKPMEEESFSLVPFTVNVTKFRELSKSKILFYSYSRTLQMFHIDSSTPSPEKLFSGNVLSVYTNPNMIRQKYKGASIMVLLCNYFLPSSSSPNLGETFKFEVKLFDSNYLLDYYVSSNSEGRPLNSPLLINMTECGDPYYVILNYNKKETAKTLVIDQIYGQLSYLSVATDFTQSTWDEMLQKDMEIVDINTRKYNLPADSRIGMDVYKIECQLPLMLNFYYVDETDLISKMNYGDVSIFTLKPYENVNVPFFADMNLPQIVIEIFNPIDNPIVIVEAQEETVYQKNTLIEITPMTLSEGINIKERGGLSDTRIIIKVGYSNRGWTTIDKYMKYNRDIDTYLFEFPNDISRYNYTFANLVTSGTNSEDNVKYCFTTNIGGALKPSSENCYRVSKDNSYTLKAYNPLIMYKDYEYDEGLSYYITFKPFTEATSFNVVAEVEKYDTNIRNYEGINNKIEIDHTGDYSSILTPPKNNEPAIFIQVQVCDDIHSIKTKIINPLTEEILYPETTIEKGTKNSYITFKNDLVDTEFFVIGEEKVNVFVRMVGLPTIYVPSFNNNYQITFDETTNTLNIESPLTKSQSMKYTVLVDRDGEITKKELTLCSFVGTDIDKMTTYTKSVVSNTLITSIQLNFDKAKINKGENFEAIVYIEQQTKSQMVFLSNIFKGTVGDIELDTIHEIDEVYTLDNNYFYKTIDAAKNETSYYFTYLPENVLEVPIGAFSIELDQTTTGSFTGVACSFVDNETEYDAMSMIESVEEVIEKGTSYCIGSQSTVNSKRYNYIFKYENKDKNTPKRLVIKVSNENSVNGKFNIYMKKDQGVTIEHTDFSTIKEYGKDEDSKKSVIPYIVDVYTLRGESETDYVSKVLFYSQHLEMQMYYIPEDSNAPIKLFCGNIALVYTKPDLAIQKYHATTLVLISENLEGQEHASIGSSFRFHTKMFKSDAQIEFFVSQNPDGRTINYPLSLEMNICTKDNDKLYYILNYNKPESTRILHLDMIFGSYSQARIAREINAEKWDSLIANSMTNIENYQIELPEKSQHIDVIEITCKSPLLLNAYYSYDEYEYNNVKEGEIVVKELPAQDSFSFTVEKGTSSLFFYSMSLFNPKETPTVTVRFSNGVEHYISENSLQTGMLMSIPEKVTVINNCKSQTRFIFKIGFGVEMNEDWKEVETEQKKDGKLFAKKNKLVYKFPIENNKKNFTKVNLVVNSINSEDENVKFCYSTNLGIAIEASRENCYRTGTKIPYTLTFINPLIVAKNYKVDTENYYISFRPFEEDDFINIEVDEEKYETSIRNELGVHNLLNGNVNSILSLSNEPNSKIFVQLKSCKETTEPIPYANLNAYTGEQLHAGKIYYTDKYGIYYTTNNILLENELRLSGEKSATLFSKHTSINVNYSPVISEYTTTFDSSTSVVTIVKPIYDEEFTITVLVGQKDSLSGITQCDLAFNDKTKYADYVNTFSSVSSNIITHYIDFNSIHYLEGTEFDLLVYAEQTYNSKMEFIYPVITGKVGKITSPVKIDEFVDEFSEYVTKSFKFNLASNYLYYDFTKKPTGNIASLKIRSTNSKVNKIGCVYTSITASDDDMVNAVNTAVLEGKSVCIGEMQKDSDGYDALINANYAEGKNRLVIQVLYGLGEEDQKLKDESEEDLSIVIKISGTKLDLNEGKYGNAENLATIPYVIDLLDIRDSKAEYVSKILFYSNTREMEMFYIDNDSPAPVSLFTGNIMLVYTNPELVRQKYHNATTMILITDALYATERTPIGEKYRFMVKFFNSAAQIQYFVSSNPDGRPLNNPTTIEMTSCDQPYYYILNYNQLEGNRKLHIDTIFGERESIKLATVLNQEDWDSLILQMEQFNGDEILLEEQDRFHFDVIEVKCKLPLLLNLFYIDPTDIKTSNLEIGDITIISLEKGKEQVLSFKTGGKGPFVYSFSIMKPNNQNPSIEIEFNTANIKSYNKNGVYSEYSFTEYERIIIRNKEDSGSTNTRVIFKFGYLVEVHFEKIENEVYSNQNDESRTDNLFAYIYDQTSTRLNYTGIDFEVTTQEDNVKFCYSTNLGTFINPSLQNCYRVGKSNSYTISTLNPLVMYRNYESDDHMNYYVGFRTVELGQNITIIPKLKKYDTDERNFEGFKNKVTISENKVDKVILTAPENHEPYIFTHIHVCTKDIPLSYEFLNAYNSSNLGFNGEIQANTKIHFKTINNTKLDTELKFYAEKGTEIFVKHVGISERYQPVLNDIEIWYDNTTRFLNWTQPIKDEEFVYNVVIDQKSALKNRSYTLCSLVDYQKLGYYTQSLTTDFENPNITVPELGANYEQFDILIVAEQTNKGKLTILSDVYDSSGKKYEPEPTPTPTPTPPPDNKESQPSNTGLIVLIVILSIVIVAGGIFAFIIYRKYKGQGEVKDKNKATSMALIKSTQNDKLIESQAQEVDP